MVVKMINLKSLLLTEKKCLEPNISGWGTQCVEQNTTRCMEDKDTVGAVPDLKHNHPSCSNGFMGRYLPDLCFEL